MATQVLTMSNEKYYVYIITNPSHTVIYTGVTNDLKRRILKYRKGTDEGFTDKQGASQLVYYETFDEPYGAITREKMLKTASSEEKMNLIEANNQTWKDLYRQL